MPLLEFECAKCGVQDVFLWPNDERPTKCPVCNKKGFHRVFVTPPKVYGDRCDWSSENSGKGRYAPQLARGPQDQTAFYPNRQAVIDEGHRRGLTADIS